MTFGWPRSIWLRTKRSPSRANPGLAIRANAAGTSDCSISGASSSARTISSGRLSSGCATPASSAAHSSNCFHPCHATYAPAPNTAKPRRISIVLLVTCLRCGASGPAAVPRDTGTSAPSAARGSPASPSAASSPTGVNSASMTSPGLTASPGTGCATGGNNSPSMGPSAATSSAPSGAGSAGLPGQEVPGGTAANQIDNVRLSGSVA